jgi:hypothetical protein
MLEQLGPVWGFLMMALVVMLGLALTAVGGIGLFRSRHRGA